MNAHEHYEGRASQAQEILRHFEKLEALAIKQCNLIESAAHETRILQTLVAFGVVIFFALILFK